MIELNILVFMLIESLFLLYGIHFSLINILLGTLIGLLLIIIFSKIKKHNIIKFIILTVTIIISIISIIKVSNFITYNLLKNYSNLLIIISLLTISYFLIKNNYHSFIKSVEIIFYFFIIIKIISFLLVIPNVHLEYFNIDLLMELKPNISIFKISLIILYLHQLIYYLTNKKVNKKSYLISMINPIIIKLLSIMIIGRTLFYLYNYPYINVLKQIKYLDFFERMEGILAFGYLFSFIVLIGFLLLSIKILIKKTD